MRFIRYRMMDVHQLDVKKKKMIDEFREETKHAKVKKVQVERIITKIKRHER